MRYASRGRPAAPRARLPGRDRRLALDVPDPAAFLVGGHEEGHREPGGLGQALHRGHVAREGAEVRDVAREDLHPADATVPDPAPDLRARERCRGSRGTASGRAAPRRSWMRRAARRTARASPRLPRPRSPGASAAEPGGTRSSEQRAQEGGQYAEVPSRPWRTCSATRASARAVSASRESVVVRSRSEPGTAAANASRTCSKASARPASSRRQEGSRKSDGRLDAQVAEDPAAGVLEGDGPVLEHGGSAWSSGRCR